MSIRGFYWSIREFVQDKRRKPFNIIAGRNGQLFEIRDDLVGRIVTRKKEVRELDHIEPAFEFRLPKMPGKLLQTILSFFRGYCNELSQNEALVLVYWDKLKKEYFLDCPYQMVSKTFIHAEFDPQFRHSDRYVCVMHIHSHNTMPAFFSRTDDENEKAYMLYGVVGRLDFYEPDFLLRVGCNGEFLEVPMGYIFENPILTPTSMAYPSEWDERIQIQNREMKWR